MTKKPKSTASKKREDSQPKSSDSTKPNIRRVRVADIVVGEKDFRPLDEKTVKSLAESIKEVGLMHLPTVCIKQPHGEGPEEHHLVAGRHRLAAAEKLGWEEIDVIAVKSVERKNKMRRITENLHRNPLSKQDEAQEIRTWVELRFAGKGGQVAQPHDKGVSDAAKQFGKSRRTIRRLLLASAIRPDVAFALRDAGLANNGSVLEHVAREKLDDQLAKVMEIFLQREEEKKKRKELRKQREEEARKKKEEEENEDDRAVDEDDDDDDVPTTESPDTAPVEDDENWDNDSADQSDGDPGLTFRRLVDEWNAADDLRTAWSEADAGDRQKFINEVLSAEQDA